MDEPLAFPLLFVTKQYLNAFSKRIPELSIDRYHYVLILIDNHGENLSQKALANILKIDKSYMVTILDYLEQHEYVLRMKNPVDRREQLVKLTPKATKDIPLIRKVISELNNKSLKNISEDKRKIFNEVLSIIERNLSNSAPVKSCSFIKKLN